MKQGFTLIELLVVVLIIGILSAIALPQYQTAIDKVRMTRLIPMARAIVEAQRRYHLANGVYSDKVEELDLSFPTKDIYDCVDGGHSTQCIKFGQDSCSLQSSQGYVHCSVGAEAYGQALSPSAAVQRRCIAYKARGHKLCQSLGGKEDVKNGSSIIYKLD